MEKIKVKRVFALATFAGPGKGYGLKVGKQYPIRIAHLIDSGSLQVHIDTPDSFLFLDYTTQDDFDQEWTKAQKISHKNYKDIPVGK